MDNLIYWLNVINSGSTQSIVIRVSAIIGSLTFVLGVFVGFILRK